MRTATAFLLITFGLAGCTRAGFGQGTTDVRGTDGQQIDTRSDSGGPRQDLRRADLVHVDGARVGVELGSVPPQDVCPKGMKLCLGKCIDPLTAVEKCNGLDDDCDPATPDGSGESQLGAPCDGMDTDLCPEGVLSCVAGSLACSDKTGNLYEVCGTGVDEDCNPATPDECR